MEHNQHNPQPPTPKKKVSNASLAVLMVALVIFAIGVILNLNFYIRSCKNTLNDQKFESDIEAAARMTGNPLTKEDIQLMKKSVKETQDEFLALRKHELANEVFPALTLNPLLPFPSNAEVKRSPIVLPDMPGLKAPKNLDDLAFAPIGVLARLIKTRQITSTDLTKMYIARLKRFDPVLKCVVTLTEDLALAQARRADDEIAAGKYRGPLHGIPWGAKDLLATKGIKTTWGTPPFKDQVLDMDATVVKRLEEAGAVLVAKLSLGELAWGDIWTGGQTKNPWNVKEGSSGSSAGPASAASAGLVGFAIGSETWGSIVSPSTRCGVTGLRPTYGRVSRYGAMCLASSMDKIGVICRNVEDCALVFNAIYGPDGMDFTLVDRPFTWDPTLDIKTLRIGYMKGLFERDDKDYKNKANDQKVLDTLRSMGVKLIPVEFPTFPIDNLGFILSVEAGASFDSFTRMGKERQMARQEEDAWPNVFRYSRLISAVDYVQANRFRTLLMIEMAKKFKDIDVYLAPSHGTNNLLLTNLTGHPAVVVPNGFNEKGSPTSITFIGNLYGEANVLAVAKAYQDAAGFVNRHPQLKR
ncbi:MAG: amidase [Candidatus Omnitrophota bacterium]